jgi:hypothetical protein
MPTPLNVTKKYLLNLTGFEVEPFVVQPQVPAHGF